MDNLHEEIWLELMGHDLARSHLAELIEQYVSEAEQQESIWQELNDALFDLLNGKLNESSASKTELYIAVAELIRKYQRMSGWASRLQAIVTKVELAVGAEPTTWPEHSDGN